MPEPGALIPDDPLQFVKRAIDEGKILWTYHVQMRLRGRSISRDMIVGSVDSFEIIESYPEDKYLPSYLVNARHQDEIFRVFFAVDVPGDNVRVVKHTGPIREIGSRVFVPKGEPHDLPCLRRPA